MFKNFYKSNNIIHSIPITGGASSPQIKLFSTSTSTSINNNTNISNDIIYDKKRILEIINSIKETNNFKLAFTHKSVCLTNIDNKSYERLEFLGDSIIEYYTSKLIYHLFSNYNEGDLTQLRSLIVGTKNLAKISKQIELDKYLNINKGVEKSNKILADIYESFICVLYIEKGEEILHEFLSLTLFNRQETKDLLKNYKLFSIPKNTSLSSNKNGGASSHLEINMNNENKISSMREITFKFNDEDINKNILLITSKEQRDLLKRISGVNDGVYTFLNNILKEVSSFRDANNLANKQLINIIKCFEDNLNIKYYQNKLINDNINTELISNNNNLKELNKNILNINKNIDLLLSKFNYNLFIIIFILTLSMIIIGVILIYIILN